MYAASYNDERASMPLPSGYSGTMLTEEESVEVGAPVHEKHEEARTGAVPGIFTGLDGLLGGNIFHDFKIGTEEILIIAAAAFVLFSGTLDIECLIILLILLFVK